MDALLCGDDAYLKVAMMLKETQRILKPGGHFFFISYGLPPAREYHFETPFLSFENGQTEICALKTNEGEPWCHWIYVSKKLPDADQVSEAHYENFMKLISGMTELERESFIPDNYPRKVSGNMEIESKENEHKKDEQNEDENKKKESDNQDNDNADSVDSTDAADKAEVDDATKNVKRVKRTASVNSGKSAKGEN